MVRVGRTNRHWIRQRFPEAFLVNLLDPEIARSLKAYPERLIEMIEQSKKDQIIIDEV